MYITNRISFLFILISVCSFTNYSLPSSIGFQLREVDEIESILDTFEFTAPRISSPECLLSHPPFTV